MHIIRHACQTIGQNILSNNLTVKSNKLKVVKMTYDTSYVVPLRHQLCRTPPLETRMNPHFFKNVLYI